VFSALEVCYDNALYKFTFDIDNESYNIRITKQRLVELKL